MFIIISRPSVAVTPSTLSARVTRFAWYLQLEPHLPLGLMTSVFLSTKSPYFEQNARIDIFRLSGLFIVSARFSLYYTYFFCKMAAPILLSLYPLPYEPTALFTLGALSGAILLSRDFLVSSVPTASVDCVFETFRSDSLICFVQAVTFCTFMPYTRFVCFLSIKLSLLSAQIHCCQCTAALHY